MTTETSTEKDLNQLTTTLQEMDLSKIPLEELEAAIQKKKQAKNQDRESYKTLVSETVPKAIFRLAQASEVITNAKGDIFKYFESVLALKNEVYGIKEKQQSHTFSSDTAEITIGFRTNDGWDDTVTAGIQKVENYISGLSQTPETAALVQMVFNLLKKDAKGNLKANRVLDLQKLTTEFNNAEFTDGVSIIAGAYKPIRSSWFIEAYIIKETGDKVNIPLSMSSVDFPAGYTFDFFTEKNADNDGSAE